MTAGGPPDDDPPGSDQNPEQGVDRHRDTGTAAILSFEHGRAARASQHRSGRQRRRPRLGSTAVRGGLGSTVLTGALVVWMLLTVTSASSTNWHGTATWLSDDAARPTAVSADSTTPLGTPPPPPLSPGPYAFRSTQPNSDEPVTYDPCRPIRIVVNNLRAPSGSAQLLRNALDRVTEASGFQFEIEGVTTEVPIHPRDAYQRDRYGDRWAPVVVAWMNEEDNPRLSDAAGLGGSSIAVAPGTSTYMYVTGVVILNGPVFDRVLSSSRGWFQAEAIIMHEFGHLLGLDHVEDDLQVMGTGRDLRVFTYQSGDLAGLAALGSGPCVPRL